MDETKMKITELTEAQKNQLPIYKDKWIEIGLRTGPANKTRREKLMGQAYKAAGLKAPKEIKWFDSPFAAKDYVKEHELDDYRCYGQHSAGWLSFYDYMREVLELKEETEALVPLIELAKEVGWFWCYEDMCLISERPVRISMTPDAENNVKVLHDEVGPAILYADKTCGYYLNGVLIVDRGKMRADWVETPADELNPKCVIEAENVEVRRELIKKLGLDRVYDTLKDKTIETKDNYELVDLKITDTEIGRYLKMTNPSVNHVHLEGVPNECDTISKALAWRDEDEGEYEEPVVLT